MTSSRKSNTDQEIYRRELFTLGVAYIVVCLAFGYFIVAFNFEYKVYQFNHILIPTYCITALSPLLLFVVKSHKIVSAILCISGSFGGIFLIYVSGGMKAPGVFWIAALPILTGMLLGKRGSLIGASMVFASIGFFEFSERFLEAPPNIIGALDLYDREKKVNLIGFTLFFCTLVYFYLMREEKSKKLLTSKNTRIENLIRILAHDVATPLSIIQFSVNRIIMNSKTLPDESIKKIKDATDRISEQLEQIKKIKALEDGKLEMKLDSVDLKKSVATVVSLLSDKAETKDVEIITEFELEHNLVVVDKQNLENQVISNLITNAIKFSFPNSKILISAKEKGDYINLSIRDYGVGIPEKILNKIFSVDAKTSRRGTSGEVGTGYGMPIVDQIMKQFGGTIKIDSWVDSGVEDESGTLITLAFKKSEA